jgi:CDP-glucose 4,6-dehydratase
LTAAELQRAYSGRRVLVTGHTGFKGGWLALWLAELGATVTGYALAAPTAPNLFTAAAVAGNLRRHVEAPLEVLPRLRVAWRAARPEVVFHLAAQPLVQESYEDPVRTFATNVLGTAHVLELARREHAPAAVVVVTSDKCYENRELRQPFRETDRLGGHDPYSASKAAAELVAASFRQSFFAASGTAVATARAGNVIGGGDWAAHRIVPDCVRALAAGRPAPVRNPRAVRPWQHVLEPLSGYLTLGARLVAVAPAERAALCDAWNFGPAEASSRLVGELADQVVAAWGSGSWLAIDGGGGHEAGVLRLAIDKARAGLGWAPRWDFATAVARTVEWYQAFYAGEEMGGWCRRQIAAYMAAAEEPR